MMKQTYKYFYCFLIIEFSIFIISIIAFINHSLAFYYLIFIVSLSTCILGYFSCRTQDYQTLKIQNSLWRNNQKLQENYYLVLKEHEKKVDVIKNDIHSKIQGFQTQAESIDSEMLLKEYQYLCSIDHCNNSIIDALLYNKIALAQSSHIKTRMDVRLPASININPMDIISIYSNLLDNAIDACILCSPEQREIELRCSLHQQNLVIYLKNSKHPDVTVDIKNNISSKSGDHGLGLPIIDQVCKKYQGTFLLENSTDFLETTITLITE